MKTDWIALKSEILNFSLHFKTLKNFLYKIEKLEMIKLNNMLEKNCTIKVSYMSENNNF